MSGVCGNIVIGAGEHREGMSGGVGRRSWEEEMEEKGAEAARDVAMWSGPVAASVGVEGEVLEVEEEEAEKSVESALVNDFSDDFSVLDNGESDFCVLVKDELAITDDLLESTKGELVPIDDLLEGAGDLPLPTNLLDTDLSSDLLDTALSTDLTSPDLLVPSDLSFPDFTSSASLT